MKHKKLSIILGIIALIIGSFIYSKEKNNKDNYLPSVNKDLLYLFKNDIDYKDIITYSQADINDDGKEDLVVVYSVNNENNLMVIVVNQEDGIHVTAPIPAPKENVVIEFKNIQDKNQKSIIISGSKNGSIGYAIYRLENRELINIFGEDMESCC